ncbi:MAG: hypothetical protein VX951_04270 [Planctomycetota bacterium]|nr:hypothetical protein [Planctomycetota bacterium]
MKDVVYLFLVRIRTLRTVTVVVGLYKYAHVAGVEYRPVISVVTLFVASLKLAHGDV